jgi:hypothetical protein
MIGRTLFCFLGVLAIAGQSLAFADEARIFENLGRWADPEKVTVSEEDLFPNPPYTHDWQSKAFFFIGRLDDGTFFLIDLFHWQLSFLRSWGLQVLVTDSADRLFRYDGGLPERDTSGPSRGFYHRFGENLFTRSGGEYRVKVELEGFSCDLHIRNLLPAWQPGDGWAYYDGAHSAYLHYAVPSPLATVSGSMIVFGNLRSVEGMCTWDSSLSVQPLGRPNSPQYSLRAFDDSGNPPGDRLFIDMVESFTDASYGSAPIPVLIVARGTTWLFTTKDFTVVPSNWKTIHEPPYPFPTSYRLRAGGRGWTLEGQFVSSRVYSTTDVFQEIPSVIRVLVSQFLKRPVLYRMVGDFRGLLTSPEGIAQPFSMPAHVEYVLVK